MNDYITIDEILERGENIGVASYVAKAGKGNVFSQTFNPPTNVGDMIHHGIFSHGINKYSQRFIFVTEFGIKLLLGIKAIGENDLQKPDLRNYKQWELAQ